MHGFLTNAHWNTLNSILSILQLHPFMPLGRAIKMQEEGGIKRVLLMEALRIPPWVSSLHSVIAGYQISIMAFRHGM